MSRRWGGFRPGPVVVAEAAERRAREDDGVDAAALRERSNARNRDLCTENKQLRERLERAGDQRDAEMRRADDAERLLAEANAHAEQQDQAIAALEAKLAAADETHAGTCDHAALIRSQRVVMARQQDRIDQLQAANEGHDRAARRRPS